ncbi:MAG: endonuclease/exonuclease/phosphatase family protein [Patescibacteria group bacterium]
MRIAVINLQSGIGITKGYGQYITSGWKYVLPHGAKYVREAGALIASENIDIALITEVDERGLRSGFLPQSEALSEYSGLPHTRFFPTRTIAPLVVEGNTILSRYPIAHTETHPLSIGTIPRVMGEVIVQMEGQRVHVFVAHLGIRNIARAKQIQDIHRIITERNEPVILGGDFNERDHEAFEILKTAGFAHIVALPTFPSWKPVHSLSVLFLSDHFQAPAASIPNAPPFSDHLPLVAETEIK